MRVVFWHPCLSIHHAPLLRRLAMMPGMQVELVAKQSLENGRDAGGWSVPDYGKTKLIDTTYRDIRELVDEVVVNDDCGTIHLISDAVFHPISRAAWKRCREKRVPFGFISIRPGMYVRQPGRALRHAFYRLYVKHAARDVNPILTVAKDCSEFFEENGFPPERIFPWAYFVENPVAANEIQPSSSLRLIYLGRLIQRKRVDLLLRAFAEVRQKIRDVRLKILGDGPESESLTKLSHELAINNAVTFVPSVPHAQVHAELRKHDALVLPTECDDWGVVVNEALQAGLAVVVSENAGASELIQHSGAGLVCKCNVASISSAMTSLARSREKLTEMHQKARAFSSQISPEIAAQYLRSIIEHTLYGAPRPAVPWHTASQTEASHEITQHCFDQRRRSMDDSNGISVAHATAHLNASQ